MATVARLAGITAAVVLQTRRCARRIWTHIYNRASRRSTQFNKKRWRRPCRQHNCAVCSTVIAAAAAPAAALCLRMPALIQSAARQGHNAAAAAVAAFVLLVPN
jgi:hypothetical protein